MKENVLILIVVALQFFHLCYYRCIVTKRSIN